MRLKPAFLALLVTFVMSTGTAYGEVIVNTEYDVPFIAFVACAGDENGEFVEGLSRFRFLLESTHDAAGKGHLGFHKHPVDPVAIGQKSGNLYGADRISRLSSNTSGRNLPFSDIFWYSFQMNGPGDNEQFHVNQQIRVTVSQKGDLHAEALRTRVSCKA